MVCDERPRDADVIQKDWLDELFRQESSSPTSASDDALVLEGEATCMRNLAGAVLYCIDAISLNSLCTEVSIDC